MNRPAAAPKKGAPAGAPPGSASQRYSTSTRSFYESFAHTSKFIATPTSKGPPPAAAPKKAPESASAPAPSTDQGPAKPPPSKKVDVQQGYKFPTLRNKIPKGAASSNKSFFENLNKQPSQPPPKKSSSSSSKSHDKKEEKKEDKKEEKKEEKKDHGEKKEHSEKHEKKKEPVVEEPPQEVAEEVQETTEGAGDEEDPAAVIEQLMAEEENLEKEVIELNELLKRSLDETDALVAELQDMDDKYEKLKVKKKESDKKLHDCLAHAKKMINASGKEKEQLEKEFTDKYLKTATSSSSKKSKK